MDSTTNVHVMYVHVLLGHRAPLLGYRKINVLSRKPGKYGFSELSLTLRCHMGEKQCQGLSFHVTAKCQTELTETVFSRDSP